MTNVTAVISMLHESPEGARPANSANRIFRQDPVLAWTLDRLCRSKRLGSIAIICWEDQIESVRPIAQEHQAHVLMKSPRVAHPMLETVSAAQRWADGWRGGLLGTCEFDRGFVGAWVVEVANEMQSDAVILVDAASGLIDPELVDQLIERAADQPEQEFVFTQAAPGLSGVLLHRGMLDRLTAGGTYPGRLLSYAPQQPARDAIAAAGCVTVPTPVARTTHRFKLDSDRQIARISAASISLNGQLISTSAEELVYRVGAHENIDDLPRELVVELTTRRETRAIFRPSGIERRDMQVEACATIFEELSQLDDARLTLDGVGDTLLHENAIDIIHRAHDAAIHAIHIQTDLLVSSTVIDELASSPVDVVSVHLPATSPQTYEAIMGVDRLAEVIENIKRFVTRRAERGRGVPILVPVFTKCRANLSEMERWYDQWLMAVGCAVIAPTSTFAGAIEDAGVGFMCPAKRSACARLSSRLTVLCDGSVVACENDVHGAATVGRIGEQTLSEIWRQGMHPLRKAHACGEWSAHRLCAACADWHCR